VAWSEPSWWYADGQGIGQKLLAPAAALYGATAVARYRRGEHERAARPVICIGNFTAGGAGKTPLTIALAALARQLGADPWTLSRGYGGALEGPVRVDPAAHSARDVGDEPLLLARGATAVVSRDRSRGARLIAEQAPPNAVILMDDGLQNGALAKDLSFAVVDRARGFGNGRVIPAGPLRAPLAFQRALADALVVNGSPDQPLRADVAEIAERAAIPVFSAWPVARDVADNWRGRRVVAFAGIANPSRFFDLLAGLGADVAARRVFTDHKSFSALDAEQLLTLARTEQAILVATEKDHVRLIGETGALGELAAATTAVGVEMKFATGDLDKIAGLLRRTIAAKS
jgi:tetraacyldisaccharide 4'-kinase